LNPRRNRCRNASMTRKRSPRSHPSLHIIHHRDRRILLARRSLGRLGESNQILVQALARARSARAEGAPGRRHFVPSRSGGIRRWSTCPGFEGSGSSRWGHFGSAGALPSSVPLLPP
jgi:hypothetical protein